MFLLFALGIMATVQPGQWVTFLAEMMVQIVKTLNKELSLGSVMKFRMQNERSCFLKHEETTFTKYNGKLELS